MMAFNVLNILIVRMQNIDYEHNRKLGRAAWDLVRYDGKEAFYKGLVPIAIAWTNVRVTQELMAQMRHPSYPNSYHMWPLIFLGGCLLAHPFMLLGMRVQCGVILNNTKRQHYKNMFTTASYLKRKQGLRGFYQGFAPAFLVYSASSYYSLKECFGDSIKILKK